MAITVGMSYETYLHSTPADINRRYKVYLENLKNEYEARSRFVKLQSWLTGSYFLAALGCAFDKNARYPENPLVLEENSVEKIAEKNGKTVDEINQETIMYSLMIREANERIAQASGK